MCSRHIYNKIPFSFFLITLLFFFFSISATLLKQTVILGMRRHSPDDSPSKWQRCIANPVYCFQSNAISMSYKYYSKYGSQLLVTTIKYLSYATYEEQKFAWTCIFEIHSAEQVVANWGGQWQSKGGTESVTRPAFSPGNACSELRTSQQGAC